MLAFEPDHLLSDETSEFGFQKMYTSIACLYIAAKFQDTQGSFTYSFDYFQSRTRQCKSFRALLSIYQLAEDEFVWDEGWYQQLE